MTRPTAVAPSIATTLESAQALGIDRYRAMVIDLHGALRLTAIAKEHLGAASQGTMWEQTRADRLATKAEVAQVFLTDVLGIDHVAVNVITRDAKAAGRTRAEDIARARGWLPKMEVAA